MSNQAERTQIAVLQNDMLQVKSDISQIKSDIKEIKSSLDGRYAAKWVQQVVGGLIALILIAVVTALLALIIIPASKKNADGTTPKGGVQSNSGSYAPTSRSSSKSSSTSSKPSDSQSVTDGVVDQLKKVTP